MIRSVLLVGLLVLYSCRQEKVPPAFDKTAYPLHIGNQWDYRVTDLFNGKIDTVVLTVTDRMEQNNIVTYNNRLEKQGMIIDSSYFILSDSLLRYGGLQSQYSFFGTFELHLPFGKGSKWNAAITTADNTIVSNYISGYPVLGKSYDVYVLERTFSVTNINLKQTLYISSKVGLVSQQFDFFDGGDRYKKKFELINHKLK